MTLKKDVCVPLTLIYSPQCYYLLQYSITVACVQIPASYMSQLVSMMMIDLALCLHDVLSQKKSSSLAITPTGSKWSYQ
jgi:hypothetical protein